MKLQAVRHLFTCSLVLGAAACVDADETELEREASELNLPTWTTSYAGSVVTVQAAPADNNAAWLVNMTDAAWGDVTKLTGTITHGGFLQAPSGQLDHIAIGTRGASFDAGLAQFMPAIPATDSRFFFGEALERAVPGTVSVANLQRMLSGRGITFWPVNSPYCRDKARPCAIFENYTVNSRGTDGLVCRNNVRDNCVESTALTLTTAPLQVTVVADDWDVRTTIRQGGVHRATISCRTITTSASAPQGDARCGAQAQDAAYGDSFVANVITTTSAPRSVGATGLTVTVGPAPGDVPPCPTCPLP